MSNGGDRRWNEEPGTQAPSGARAPARARTEALHDREPWHRSPSRPKGGVQRMNGQVTSRDRVLTTLAVLMGIMAISNLWKPIAQALSPDSSAGFVFFGNRLHGVANAIVGPLFGGVLGAYAYGVWTMQRWVMRIALAYA